MTRLIALLGLVAASVATNLGSFWFVYGIWPRSWSAFVFFALCSATLTLLIRTVISEKE